MITFETRDSNDELEIRSENGVLTAIGYAARFHARSFDLGGFTEVISPGAFTKTLQEQNVRALFNHNPDFPLGTSRSGTLRLAEDSLGLRYEVDLPDTTVGRDVARLLERGDITGSSFGFKPVRIKRESDNGVLVRNLQEVRLRDVGPVTFPAYPDATVYLRSLAEETQIEFDAIIEAANANNLASLLEERSNPKVDEEIEPAIEVTRYFHRNVNVR